MRNAKTHSCEKECYAGAKLERKIKQLFLSLLKRNRNISLKIDYRQNDTRDSKCVNATAFWVFFFFLKRFARSEVQSNNSSNSSARSRPIIHEPSCDWPCATLKIHIHRLMANGTLRKYIENKWRLLAILDTPKL